MSSPHCDTPCHGWQLEVTQTLARLVEATEGLKAQVTRQNGNVAALTSRMNSVEQNQAAIAAADRAEEKATAPWHRWAERAVVALLTVIAVLALKHSADLLPK